jgi:hypothetical protein
VSSVKLVYQTNPKSCSNIFIMITMNVKKCVREMKVMAIELQFCQVEFCTI